MRGPLRVALRTAACAACLAAALAHGAVKTVCTITVNSSDEAAAFRRALPPNEYRFVELVARGDADWLASACRRGVACDVLVVSGHYDGEGMFFSDQVDRDEHLPLGELERAACSEACPGLFAQLKQVYLFGCQTLAPEPVNGTGTPVHSIDVALGAPPARTRSARHGESSRQRMSRIFKDVPVIYGFASTAPLGPAAGDVLSRWLRSGGTAEVGTGRASSRLLALFAAHGMATTRGVTAKDARFAARNEVCGFEDERLGPVERALRVHELLARGPRDVRVYLDHLERFVGRLTEFERRAPPLSAALEAIARDSVVRDRYLAYARGVDEAPLRARLLALAQALGWIDATTLHDEWGTLLVERLERGAQPDDIDLACRLARDGMLASQVPRIGGAVAAGVERHAMLACLGDEDARATVLATLATMEQRGVELAEVLLRHRPLRDAAELQHLVRAIGSMSATPAMQERALHALAGQRAIDTRAAGIVVDMFPDASLPVQRAIAGVLVRADLTAIDTGALVRMLHRHRRPSLEGRDLIDVLIGRLADRAPGLL